MGDKVLRPDQHCNWRGYLEFHEHGIDAMSHHHSLATRPMRPKRRDRERGGEGETMDWVTIPITTGNVLVWHPAQGSFPWPIAITTANRMSRNANKTHVQHIRGAPISTIRVHTNPYKSIDEWLAPGITAHDMVCAWRQKEYYSNICNCRPWGQWCCTNPTPDRSYQCTVHIACISIKSVEVAPHEFTAIQLKIERAGVINPGLSYVLHLKVGKNRTTSYWGVHKCVGSRV